MRPIPTAPFAAGSFLVAWGVVDASGSRTLGGLVLLACAAALGFLWRARCGRGVAARLLGAGVAAFVVSHALGLLIGAWPAVIVSAAAMGWLTWRLADSRPRSYDARPGEVSPGAVEPGPYSA
jgi:hypothetical protein